ncbi:MAG TPA: T9SS type A sorting domain-containing protein, partial [Bacteroidia bacterium]|nr:T9SS type A sorting domain-containing protein [Bacteroidia bacterium]
TTGDKYLYCYTTNPNGAATDGNTANNRLSRRLTIKATNAAMPVVQSFSATTFPPSQWTNKRYDCNTGWGRNTTAYFSAPASMYFNNFGQTPGNAKRIFDLYTQPINLSTQPNPTLSFNVAYAQRNASTLDTLEILISTDCGYTYTSVYKKWGTALETASATTSAFIPTSTQWRNEVINLTAYATATNAIFIVRNITKGGNNVYIDDITVDQLQGIELNDVSDLVTVFPNPTSGLFQINIPASNQVSYVSVVSALGETVIHKNTIEAGLTSTTFDLSNFVNGVYFVTIENENGKAVKKVSLNK